MRLGGFEPVIPASEQPQTHGLDRAAIAIGPHIVTVITQKRNGYGI